jgi:hypothetical protein
MMPIQMVKSRPVKHKIVVVPKRATSGRGISKLKQGPRSCSSNRTLSYAQSGLERWDYVYIQCACVTKYFEDVDSSMRQV